MSEEPVRTLDPFALPPNAGYCVHAAEGYCVTCADEAVAVMVLSVDQEAGLARVAIQTLTEEVDITLVEDVAPGDTLLVHGGVAIARMDGGHDA